MRRALCSLDTLALRPLRAEATRKNLEWHACMRLLPARYPVTFPILRFVGRDSDHGNACYKDAMIREILIWPDPRLKEKAVPVDAVDETIRTLVDDMFETMYAADGVGLAAPQIGVLQRVIVIDTSPAEEEGEPLALINPEILEKEGTLKWREGCLSVPGEAEEVTRSARVRVRFLDRDGAPKELEATGLTAVAIQHECDHLDGVLFVDYLSTLKRELIRKRMKRVKAERVEDAQPARA